ncbi:MAG: sulfatase-like hydrolase/transferase [Planctomycetota bacterium]|nr:sulfatase-like hydrolase/transferase [Planctomycetota bacterium]
MDRPNVVLIMADDLGYGDLSCYGSQKLRTIHLDRLAREGCRLTGFYAGCTVCTPSRMALLSGIYPARLGWKGGVIGHRIPSRNGLAPQVLTLAELFQEAGYSTALSGKWHLGEAADQLPMNQGFESCYYITKSNNQTKKLYRDGKLIADPFTNRLLSEQFTDHAIEFIRENSNRPFFLYLPYTAPHFPAEPHPDWKGKSSLGKYGDVVEELDARIGQLLKTLTELQLDQRTIVIFLSDNGPEPGQKKWATAAPYRGLKWSALEGGNRVPCLVRYPPRIPAGQVLPELTAAIDLFPTLASACGIDVESFPHSNPPLDGLNVWETWTQKSGSVHPRNQLLIWHGWGTLQAIRDGDWKLYVDQVPEIEATRKGPVLIHLPDDPAEKTNLAARHPELVKKMKKLARVELELLRKNSRPLGGPPMKPSIPKHPAWLDETKAP